MASMTNSELSRQHPWTRTRALKEAKLPKNGQAFVILDKCEKGRKSCVLLYQDLTCPFQWRIGLRQFVEHEEMYE